MNKLHFRIGSDEELYCNVWAQTGGADIVVSWTSARRLHQHASPLGLMYKEDIKLRQILFYYGLAWLESTVLCVAPAHPDLGSDLNTLNQLGPTEGHFVLSFI